MSQSTVDNTVDKWIIKQAIDDMVNTINKNFQIQQQTSRSQKSLIWKYYYIIENSYVVTNKVPILYIFAICIKKILRLFADVDMH